MSARRWWVVASCVALCGGASAQDAAEPSSSASASASEDARRISVTHQGTVREVLRAIADEGGISLVVQGQLDAPAEVVLREVTPEEALQTVAAGWNLEVARAGNIFTVRARGAAPSPTQPSPPPAPAAADVKSAGNRVVFGSSSEVGPDEVVDKVVVYGGSLRVDGRVLGNAAVFGGNLELGPTALVEGKVDTFGGSVYRHEGAQIVGRVRTFGGEVVDGPAPDAAAEAEAEAAAERAEEEAERAEEEAAAQARAERDASPGTAVADFLTWFAVLFGIGFGAAMLAPSRMKVVQEEIRRAPGKSALFGLLFAFLLPFVSVLLMVTIIGIPVVLLVLWPLALVAAFVGLTAVAYELGARLPFFRGRKSQALVLALGLLTILLAAQLPVLGVMTVLAFSTCGFGAIVRTRFGRGRKVPPSVLRDDLPTGVAL